MPETPDSFEKGPESIPNERIVFNKFDEIVSGRGFEEDDRRRLEDEKGLARCEVVTTDEGGNRLDLEYNRGKTAKGGEVLNSRITQTLYTPDGMPCGAGP